MKRDFRIGSPSAVWLAGTLLAATLAPSFAPAQDDQSPLARSMGITQHLGAYVPKDVEFKDETGKTVHFGDMLHTRPVVLVPIFYNCQTGCSFLAEQIIATLAKANKSGDKLVVGRDLDILMVSIHPKETSDLANSKREFFLKAFEPPSATPQWWSETRQGWHLLTGDSASIHKVTDAIGFKYSYNAEKNLINHPTCTVILSPAGRISSYTIGNEFPTRVVEDDLALAARNEVGEPADQSMMFGCIMLDPITHKYRVVIENVLRVLGVLTVLIMAFWIGGMSLKTKREEQNRKGGPPVADGKRLGTSR
jgi:protein SCO1